MIKYVTGYNHYSKRNTKINNDLCLTKCLWYNRCEDWDHTILCDGNEILKEVYARELEQILKKSSRRESEHDIVNLIIANIQIYLCKENKEYITT